MDWQLKAKERKISLIECFSFVVEPINDAFYVEARILRPLYLQKLGPLLQPSTVVVFVTREYFVYTLICVALDRM